MNKNKIGTLFGVFIPNVTMMFGVILFLRMGIIVSHTGPFVMSSVIALSLIIMLITSASIASIATNMEVGTGGVYYLVTRSLGIEMGGALGLVTYLAQLMSISLTVSGFSYFMADLFPHLSTTLVEVLSLIVLTAVSSSSAKLALKLQGIILLILVASIVAVFFGSIGPMESIPTQTTPFYDKGTLSFWAGFALFYPAMTGIEAGMALSGNLKDPGKSLMIGNVSSLLFTAAAYLILSLYAFDMIPLNLLKSDPFALVEYANPSWLVKLGICVATLSSALGSLLGAPRMLQSMAEDGVVFSIFNKTHGKEEEPRWAILFTFVASLIVTIATTIDNIIPMLTMICLINYGLLNFISALAAWMNSPSWKPQFKVPYWISLIGLILCILAMFMINPGWSFISLIVVFLLYLLLKRFDLDVGFQDFRNSISFFLSRLALYRLANSDEGALTWHPKLLVLSGAPTNHPKTIWIANSLTHQSGLLTFATVVPNEWAEPERLRLTRSSLESFFRKKNISCLIEVNHAASTSQGHLNLIQAYGIGPIQPNTVVVPIDESSSLNMDVVEIIYACRIHRKNIILIQDDPNTDEKVFQRRVIGRRKRINLLWDSENRSSFNLLISIISILHDSSKWNKAIVNLHAQISHEDESSTTNDYLQEFVDQSKLPMNISTGPKRVGSLEEDVDIFATVFRQVEEDESQDHYLNYLQSHLDSNQHRGVGIFVCSFDQTEHKEILCK